MNVITYRRVSTDRQGKSGLGLAAQETAISTYLAGLHPKPNLLGEYTEVESGSHSDRPALQKALDHARLTKAVLVIGKLDRLSRDAHFLLGLSKAGIEFVACDMPYANRLTVGIMALVAEEERRMISDRTKAALAAAKARGTRLGNPNGAKHLRKFGNVFGAAAAHRKAMARSAALEPTIAAIRATGVTSASGIARSLNEASISTPRGGRWSAKTATDILKRLPQPVEARP